MAEPNTIMELMQDLGAANRYILLHSAYETLAREKNRDDETFTHEKQWLMDRCRIMMPLAHAEIEIEDAAEHAQVLREIDDNAPD